MPIETSLCNLYIDCVNDQLDSEALFRMLIKNDGGCAALSVVGGGGGVPVGLATETTLLALLAETNKDFDFEIKCVRDTNTGIIYILRIQKDETDGSITIDYIDATGSVVVPPVPGNLVVCDASAALALILAELQAVVVRTPSLSVISGVSAVPVPAGARSVTFFNQGPTNATIAGGVLAPGESMTFDAGGENDTLGAIAVTTIATGVLKIIKVV